MKTNSLITENSASSCIVKSFEIGSHIAQSGLRNLYVVEAGLEPLTLLLLSPKQ